MGEEDQPDRITSGDQRGGEHRGKPGVFFSGRTYLKNHQNTLEQKKSKLVSDTASPAAEHFTLGPLRSQADGGFKGKIFFLLSFSLMNARNKKDKT